MDQKTITHALALPDDASDRDILDRIHDLRADAGEEDIADLSDRELLRRGEHQHVSIGPTGATVTLYVPIKSGTEPLTELAIRRPTARSLRKMGEVKGNDFARGLAMLAELTGRAPVELDMLDAADASLCMTVIGFLQRPPRRTGSSSSAS